MGSSFIDGFTELGQSMHHPEYIVSIKHEKVIEARSLASAKERIAQHRALVEGEEQVCGP